MSSLIEERISRNIARQQENFKRQQEIISSFNEDFLNSSSDNLVEPMVFLDELDMSLSQIRVSGKAFDGQGIALVIAFRRRPPIVLLYPLQV